MPLKDLFVIGVRVGGGRNGKKRTPRFVHALRDGSKSETRCSVDVTRWSRRYLRRAELPDALHDMLCITCAKIMGLV